MSKACWQGFETQIKNLIGGTKQYAQSVKFYVRKEKLALGDVKNSKILAECKVRDFATKKFRAKHPAKVYPLFNIEYAWWEQLVQECADVNANEGVKRIPVLFTKPKYGRDEHVLVWMWGKDHADMVSAVAESPYLGFPGTWYLNNKEEGINKKSVTVKYEDADDENRTRFPFTFIRDDGEMIQVMKLKHFELVRSQWADPIEVSHDASTR